MDIRIKPVKLVKRGKNYQLYYYAPDGRRRRLSVGSDSQLAHRLSIKFTDWLIESKDPERELERTKQVEQARAVTLKKFYPIFLERYGKRQSLNAQKNYRIFIANLSRCPQLSEAPISGIRKRLVLDYMQARIETDGVTPATVNREASFVRGMLSRAVEWDILEHNPLQGIRLFKEAGKRDICVTPAQAKALLNELEKPLADIVEFAIYTGFRKENILSLRFKQVRLFDLTPNGEADLEVKGGRLETFPLGVQAVKILRRAKGKREHGFVFLNPKTGTRWFSIHKAFNQAVRKTGLSAKNGSKLRFHDLRHVFATWLHQAGVSLDDIRPLMGHKDRAMTDRYATIDRSAVAAKLALMPRI